MFSNHGVKTVLDVGCGTATHLALLEKSGYSCDGIDYNAEMIAIAKTKLKGHIFHGDMRSFQLNKCYDAVLSLFAVFNHNLNLEDAHNNLYQLKSHLKRHGLLILDLRNPQASGKKSDSWEKLPK